MVMSVAAATSGGINASDPSILERTWPSIRLFDAVSSLNHPPWAVNTSTPQRDLWPYVNRSSTLCGWGYVGDQENHVNPDTHVCQSWQIASPGVTDSFSAECFFTAVSLIENDAVPDGRNVGLVLSAYSGTAMETWTPPEAFDGCEKKTAAMSIDVTSSAWPADEGLRAGTSQWILPDADSCLWNSMINPLVGFGIRAVIWNQGEANIGDTFERFSCVFKNMITAWRDHWGIGDFPFVCTQVGDQGGAWLQTCPLSLFVLLTQRPLPLAMTWSVNARLALRVLGLMPCSQNVVCSIPLRQVPGRATSLQFATPSCRFSSLWPTLEWSVRMIKVTTVVAASAMVPVFGGNIVATVATTRHTSAALTRGDFLACTLASSRRLAAELLWCVLLDPAHSGLVAIILMRTCARVHVVVFVVALGDLVAGVEEVTGPLLMHMHR